MVLGTRNLKCWVLGPLSSRSLWLQDPSEVLLNQEAQKFRSLTPLYIARTKTDCWKQGLRYILSPKQASEEPRTFTTAPMKHPHRKTSALLQTLPDTSGRSAAALPPPIGRPNSSLQFVSCWKHPLVCWAEKGPASPISFVKRRQVHHLVEVYSRGSRSKKCTGPRFARTPQLLVQTTRKTQQTAEDRVKP